VETETRPTGKPPIPEMAPGRVAQAPVVRTAVLSPEVIAPNSMSNHFRRHAHFFDLTGFGRVLVFSFVISRFPCVPSGRPPFIGIGVAVFPGACCFVSFDHDICEFVRIASDACLGHRVCGKVVKGEKRRSGEGRHRISVPFSRRITDPTRIEAGAG